MKSNLATKTLIIGCATVLTALTVSAQQHRWAGRTLNEVEWTIHEKLTSLPSYGVFDTIDFEVRGNAVTLSGQVIGERLKERAERAVKQVNTIERVVNDIEVLPVSRHDDALRMSMYRALYDNQPAGKISASASRPIHIIVKNGWVTLEGVVESDADRDMFHLRAFQVTAHVSDKLRVAPDESSAKLVGSR
jgi:hyperosmotically inducible protein